MIQRLKKKQNVLLTTRKYNQVTDLAKIRKQKLVIIGKHGGSKRHDKLNASLHRAKSLSLRIKGFSPVSIILLGSIPAIKSSIA